MKVNKVHVGGVWKFWNGNTKLYTASEVNHWGKKRIGSIAVKFYGVGRPTVYTL